MTAPDAILACMTRTLVVLSYMQWCDAWDEARGKGRRPKTACSAGAGEDGMDFAPAGSSALRREARDQAAIIYGRIQEQWGTAPAYQLHNDRDRDRWGHDAIVSAVGHGVAWEDSHDPLRDRDGAETRVRGMSEEPPMWPGRWPKVSEWK